MQCLKVNKLFDVFRMVPNRPHRRCKIHLSSERSETKNDTLNENDFQKKEKNVLSIEEKEKKDQLKRRGLNQWCIKNHIQLLFFHLKKDIPYIIVTIFLRLPRKYQSS